MTACEGAVTDKAAAQSQTIYLACALTLNKPLIDHGLPPPTFIAADGNLLAAAQSEGLTTENPNDHP